MSSNATRSVSALFALFASTPAYAAWWDYTSDGFTPGDHVPVQVDCDTTDEGCSQTLDDRLGIVFVHGMGDDCAPTLAPELAGEPLFLPDDDPRLEGVNQTHWTLRDSDAVRYELSGSTVYPATDTRWFMYPQSAGPSCYGPNYWSGRMLTQVATVGPIDDLLNGDRLPTLVVGYNGLDAWGGSATADPPAFTVARQINMFIDEYDLDRVSVVTHSMGGVVTRDLFSRAAAYPSIEDRSAGENWRTNEHYNIQRAAAHVARVITLAAPQTGSEVADLHGRLVGHDHALYQIAVEQFGAQGLSAARVVDLVADANEALLNQIEERNHPGTASLWTTRMAVANTDRLNGTDGAPALHVPWFNIAGTDTWNFLDTDEYVAIGKRDRTITCDTISIPYHNVTGCAESAGLWAFQRVSDMAPEAGGDGMVSVPSATAVGVNVGYTTSNHLHNSRGDISHSEDTLDLISLIRYYAHADGDPSPYFVAMLDKYAPPVANVSEPLLEPVEANLSGGWVHRPQNIVPWLADRALDCDTEGVVASGDAYTTHTGQFTVQFEQAFTPNDAVFRKWPSRYAVTLHHLGTGRVVAPEVEGVGTGQVVVTPGTPPTLDTDLSYVQPVAEPSAAGVVDVTLAIDLADTDGIWGSYLGDYQVQVAACDLLGCSEPVMMDGVVRVELDEFVDPADFVSPALCADTVIGGRRPTGRTHPGALLSEAVLEAAEKAGELGMSKPNTYEYADQPVWPLDD